MERDSLVLWATAPVTPMVGVASSKAQVDAVYANDYFTELTEPPSD